MPLSMATTTSTPRTVPNAHRPARLSSANRSVAREGESQIHTWRFRTGCGVVITDTEFEVTGIGVWKRDKRSKNPNWASTRISAGKLNLMQMRAAYC
jgi:hypothetical protein